MNISRALLLGTASLAITTAAVDLLGAGTAFGATEHFTKSYGFDPTPWNGVSPQGVSLPYFNGLLGTLLSVSIELQVSVSGHATLTNSSTLNAIGSVTGSTLVALMPKTSTPPIGAPGGNLLEKVIPVIGSGTGTFAPGYTKTVTYAGLHGTTSGVIGPTGYTGAGSFYLPLYAAANETSHLTGGNVAFAQVTDAKATVEITYSYGTQKIPEPASMVLLGSALVGIGAVRQRGWRVAGALEWLRKRSGRSQT